MGRLLAAASLILLVVASGCAGTDGKGQDASKVPDSIQNVQVTDDTGAIRGVVVDQKVTPLKDARVSLRGREESKLTGDDGAFVFTGLPSGDYFLTAEKVGYQAIQSSATVVAGLKEPPVTRMIMTVDNATSPFVELQNWRAFLQCGAGAPVDNPVSGPHTTVNPCFETGSDNVHDFNFGAGAMPDYAQGEAVWTGTQPLGNRLQFGYYDPASLATNWKTVDGPSPLILPATPEEITAAVGNGTDHLTIRVFAGTDQPTVVVNQGYDVYMQYFYNFVPRAGYTFANDGPCDPITVCQ